MASYTARPFSQPAILLAALLVSFSNKALASYDQKLASTDSVIRQFGRVAIAWIAKNDRRSCTLDSYNLEIRMACGSG